MTHVEVGSAAQKDLRKVFRTPAGRAIKHVILEELSAEPWPDNLDVVALEGMGEWLRVRVGEFRVVLRPLTAAECRGLDVAKGYFVDRVVNRRDLERILRAYR